MTRPIVGYVLPRSAFSSRWIRRTGNFLRRITPGYITHRAITIRSSAPATQGAIKRIEELPVCWSSKFAFNILAAKNENSPHRATFSTRSASSGISSDRYGVGITHLKFSIEEDEPSEPGLTSCYYNVCYSKSAKVAKDNFDTRLKEAGMMRCGH